MKKYDKTKEEIIQMYEEYKKKEKSDIIYTTEHFLKEKNIPYLYVKDIGYKEGEIIKKSEYAIVLERFYLIYTKHGVISMPEFIFHTGELLRKEVDYLDDFKIQLIKEKKYYFKNKESLNKKEKEILENITFIYKKCRLKDILS